MSTSNQRVSSDSSDSKAEVSFTGANSSLAQENSGRILVSHRCPHGQGQLLSGATPIHARAGLRQATTAGSSSGGPRSERSSRTRGLGSRGGAIGKPPRLRTWCHDPEDRRSKSLVRRGADQVGGHDNPSPPRPPSPAASSYAPTLPRGQFQQGSTKPITMPLPPLPDHRVERR